MYPLKVFIWYASTVRKGAGIYFVMLILLSRSTMDLFYRYRNY